MLLWINYPLKCPSEEKALHCTNACTNGEMLYTVGRQGGLRTTSRGRSTGEWCCDRLSSSTAASRCDTAATAYSSLYTLAVCREGCVHSAAVRT